MDRIRDELNYRLPIVCIFCKRTIEIEFDLELHLHEEHRMELLRLCWGKGSLDSRIKYAIAEGTKVAAAIKHLNKEDRMKLGFCSEGANI